MERQKIFCGGRLLIPLLIQFNAFAGAQTTAVLPAKVFRGIIATSATLNLTQELTEDGKTRVLGAEYNTRFDSSKIQMMMPQTVPLFQGLNQATGGLANSIHFGELLVECTPSVLAVVPAIEYGLNTRVTLGAQIPVLMVENQVKRLAFNNTFAQNTEATEEKLNQQISQLEQIPSPTPEQQGQLQQLKVLAGGLLQLKGQVISQQTVDSFLSSRGYGGFEKFNRAGLGDIRLGAKVKAFEKGPYHLAVKAGVVLPTGEADDPSSLMDVPTGDGQWDLGFNIIQDYEVTDWLVMSGVFGFTAQLPDTEQARVPENETDLIPLALERLDRDLGEKLNVEVGPSFPLKNIGLTLSGGYFFDYKFKDSWGRGAQNLRYDLISRETETIGHSFDLAIEYTTVPLYRRRVFPIALEATLVYSQPFAGKNIRLAKNLSSQLRVYF